MTIVCALTFVAGMAISMAGLVGRPRTPSVIADDGESVMVMSPSKDLPRSTDYPLIFAGIFVGSLSFAGIVLSEGWV